MILDWLTKADERRFSQLDYIAQRNASAALKADQEIETQVNQLLEHPGMGRPGRVKGTRELVISRTPFIVVFRVRPKLGRIEIIRFLHSSQRYPVINSQPLEKVNLAQT